MPLTLAQFQDRFKKIGKLIHLSQLCPPQSLAIKRAHVATVDQFINTDDPSVEFEVNGQVCVPLGEHVQAAARVLAAMPDKAKAAVDVYLRRFVAADVGVTLKSPTAAQVGGPLVAAMSLAGATVADAATSPAGFAAYFEKSFAISLPTDPAPTVPDSYITDAVI